MRISKLMMPAVTLAGALALAGCGGGSDSPTVTDTRTVGTTTLTIQPGDTSRHNGTNYTCDKDRTTACTITITNGVIQSGAEGITTDTGPAPSGTVLGSLDNVAYLISQGSQQNDLNEAEGAIADAVTDSSNDNYVYYDEKGAGKPWHHKDVLNAKETTLNIDGVSSKVHALKLASGKALSDLSLSQLNSDGDPVSRGVQVTGAAYKGIPGALVCGADACGASDGKLDGNWYFVSTGDSADSGTDPDRWVKDGDDTYKPEAVFGEWGVWLTTDDQGSGGEVAWDWAAGGYTAGPDLSVPTGVASKTATFKGDAGGVSVLVEEKDDKEVRTVGRFMAEAEMTVTFADTSTLKGKIYGFKGPATDDWTLHLNAKDLNATGATTDTLSDTSEGATQTSIGLSELKAPEGSWAGQLYGSEGERPDGVVGNFDGRFLNGQAVGVFGTK